MGCSKCEEYNKSAGRCMLGKINPKTIKGAISAVPFMGIIAVCNKDGMQTKVLKKFKK